MITSPVNLLISDTIGAASYVPCVAGKTAENLLINDILRVYATEGNFDISVYNVGSISLDVIAVPNVYFDETMTIELYDDGDALIYSQVFTVNDLRGFDYPGVYMLVPASLEYINRIRIYSSGGDDYVEKYLGYVWAGMAIDLGCIESCVPVLSSNDGVQITRTNHPDVNESYLYQSMDLTVKKENDYDELRDGMKAILTDGYGKGRPWILTEPPFNGELLWANMDSGQVKFDLFPFKSKSTGNDYSAQYTIGLREVT